MDTEAKGLAADRGGYVSWAQRAPAETRDVYCLRMAEVAANDGLRQSFLRHAKSCELDAQLVESSRKCLSESRELLARVSAILGVQRAEPTVSKVHGSQGNLLHEAMERVFDRWTDEKASPLPRSA
jgi:hypothetical protein